MSRAACQVYTLWSRQHKLYVLWLSHALSVPIGVLVFPLGYFLCFHPVGKIAQILYRKITHKCCKHRLSFNYDEEQSMIQHATAPRSNSISLNREVYNDISYVIAVSEQQFYIIATKGL